MSLLGLPLTRKGLTNQTLSEAMAEPSIRGLQWEVSPLLGQWKVWLS